MASFLNLALDAVNLEKQDEVELLAALCLKEEDAVDQQEDDEDEDDDLFAPTLDPYYATDSSFEDAVDIGYTQEF